MIIKEKNLIKFVNAENMNRGCIDINTGIIYGVKGHAIKTFSSEMREELRKTDLALGKLLFGSLRFSITDTIELLKKNALNRADRLLALNITVYSLADVCDISEEKFNAWIRDKDFITYCKNSNGGFNKYDHDCYEDIKFTKLFSETYQSSVLESHYLTDIYRTCDYNKKYINYLIEYVLPREDYHFECALPDYKNYNFDDYIHGNIQSCLSNFLIAYYGLTKRLHRDWNKKNIFEDFNRCHWLYWNFKIANEDKTFQLHENKDILGFSYGNFEVVVPTCGDDLITEGRLMHHCVGSYVNNVIRGKCAIVFVRHKNNLNTPYITCEVCEDGEIRQYYLAYDCNISSSEDKTFKEEYQKYLDSVQPKIASMLSASLSYEG